MAANYWLDLFTYQTWTEFLKAGGQVSGFRQNRWKTTQQIKPGDIFLCYLTGLSRWIGILEVTRHHTRVQELFAAVFVVSSGFQLEATIMRAHILAALLAATFALPSAAAVRPVKGTVHGTTTAAKGVVHGAGQAGRGVARGTVTAARGIGHGAVCLFTLGTRC